MSGEARQSAEIDVLCSEAQFHGNPFRYCGACGWMEPQPEQPYERTPLGNHAQGYECRTCYAVAASEAGAKAHQRWHQEVNRG